MKSEKSNFQLWAEEINEQWFGYIATFTDDATIVWEDGKEVGRIDYDNGRYTVTSADEDVREQLEYYTNR